MSMKHYKDELRRILPIKLKNTKNFKKFADESKDIETEKFYNRLVRRNVYEVKQIMKLGKDYETKFKKFLKEEK